MEYAEMILAERARRRVRQNALADRVGIYRATLVDIERARIGITEATYNTIMDAIGEIADEKSTEASDA